MTDSNQTTMMDSVLIENHLHVGGTLCAHVANISEFVIIQSGSNNNTKTLTYDYFIGVDSNVTDTVDRLAALEHLVDSNLKYGVQWKTSKEDYICPALIDNITTIIDSVNIEGNLHVGGTICAKALSFEEFIVQENFGVTGPTTLAGPNTLGNSSFIGSVSFDGPVILNDSFSVSPTSSNFDVGKQLKLSVDDQYWIQYIDKESSYDLVFKAKSGVEVVFNNDFVPEILNFTGKHRCVLNSKRIEDHIGKIVVSTGKYSNLYGKSEIEIDEAIPIVDISKKQRDKRAFGVVGGYDDDGTFKIGNIQFKNIGILPRAIIQSVGEGAIWITNLNGPLENGDFITTSEYPGMGMKQDEVYKTNFTVAKITCDCDFDLNSSIYKCEEVAFKKQKVRRAFVGCVYQI